MRDLVWFDERHGLRLLEHRGREPGGDQGQPDERQQQRLEQQGGGLGAGQLIPLPIRAASAAVLLVLLSLVSASGCGGGEDEDPAQPRIVTAEQLSEFAAESDQPVYWVGPREDVAYELTETDGGRIFVRYLDEGVPAGDPRPKYLTVGTYPSPDATAALARVARERDDVELARTDDGAVLLVGRGSAGRAHLAYPGDEVEVEVYGPAEGEALRLASRGAVQPVPRRG